MKIFSLERLLQKSYFIEDEDKLYRHIDIHQCGICSFKYISQYQQGLLGPTYYSSYCDICNTIIIEGCEGDKDGEHEIIGKCGSCGDFSCKDCTAINCLDCGRIRCNYCVKICKECEEYICSYCNECHNNFCEDCLDDDICDQCSLK